MLLHNQDKQLTTIGFRASALIGAPRVGLPTGPFRGPSVTPTPVPSKEALRAPSPDLLRHPWLRGRVGSGSRAAARRAGNGLLRRGDDK